VALRATCPTGEDDPVLTVADEALVALAERLQRLCLERHETVATAESCTGGLVAAALTAIAGSSDVVERGFFTYSNDAKMELLDVPAETIAQHGAVSAQTAAAMARGAVAHAGADLAVSTTGFAGPGGGTAQKPVGLVFLGVATRAGASRVERRIFPGDRGEIRRAALVEALEMLRAEAKPG
jgi:nicotinamide-nucleotide amidase